MKNSKMETVNGFLTPSKLLSSFKQPPKPKSQLNSKSIIVSPREQNSSIIKLAQELQHPNRNSKGYENDNFQQNFKDNKQPIGNQLSSSRNSSKHDYKINKQENIQINNSRNHQDNRNYNYQDQHYAKRSSRYSKKQQNINTSIPIPNQQINNLHSRQLINRLQSIKKELQYELNKLKILLDQTGVHLKNIDNQYLKIKEHILKYTSNYLDYAFNQYKKKMSWDKFQQFQLTGLKYLSDINVDIQEKQKQLNYQDQYTHNQINNSIRISTNKYSNSSKIHIDNRKLQEKIDQYNEIVKDMGIIRIECQKMRPKITQQRLKKFESVLTELGKF